jgi:hypothetical protein
MKIRYLAPDVLTLQLSAHPDPLHKFNPIVWNTTGHPKKIPQHKQPIQFFCDKE